MKRFCSASPNFNRETQMCCEKHDRDYEKGECSRFEADRRLMVCVTENGTPYRAILMFLALRVGGWYRWWRARKREL